ncbi:peptidase MA family metallohydrolase [Stieleria neptunia]|nr:hypothetical protein [Stieleria neptunia]
MDILAKLAEKRTGKTVIHFVSGARQESIVHIKAPQDSSANSLTKLVSFFRESGVGQITFSARAIGPDIDPDKDLQNVSIRVIARHDPGRSPQLVTKLFNPPPPDFVKLHLRGLRASASIAGPDEVEKELILLRGEGPFQLHPFLEAAALLRQSPLIADCDVIVKFPFVDWGDEKEKIPARILAALQKQNSSEPPMQPIGSAAGIPGPPHLPLAAPGQIASPGPVVNPFGAPPAAAGVYPAPKSRRVEHSQLARQAILADKKSQTKANELRSAGNANTDQAIARKILGPMVVEAFDAKQALYQAELDSLSQRVSRLKELVTERQKAKGQIIARRIDELLNPDLKWDATASNAAKSASIPDHPVVPITSTRTNHFFVSGDPFAETVPADTLENVAKTAEGAFRELTQEWFGTIPVDFKESCGIDVQVAETTRSAQGATTYRFTPDGKVTGAMMHLQGSPTNLDERLTHEVMHLVLAANFNVKLPLWIDEGIAMLAGDSSGVPDAARRTVAEAANNETLIPLHELFSMKSYPTDREHLKLMHQQSGLLVDWLVAQGGKRKLIECMRSVPSDKMASQLPDAVVSTYGFESLADLEAQWIETLKSLRSEVSTSPFAD